MIIGYILLTVVVLALIAAIYNGMGGRALFSTREVPQVIIGQTVQLCECEHLTFPRPELPSAKVTSYNSPDYRLDFVTPFIFEGREERFVRIRNRHRGHPVSSAARLHVWVAATLESGRGFIARISVCHASPNPVLNNKLL
jgi:hypothetical protein